MEDGNLTLIYRIRPHPKGRPRFSRSGHAYTDQKTRDFEKEIMKLTKAQWKYPPIEGPVRLGINFYYKRPKSDPKREHHIQRPDIDNLAKAILDPIQGCLISADSQISDLRLWKGYADADYITLHIESLVEQPQSQP